MMPNGTKAGAKGVSGSKASSGRPAIAGARGSSGNSALSGPTGKSGSVGAGDWVNEGRKTRKGWGGSGFSLGAWVVPKKCMGPMLGAGCLGNGVVCFKNKEARLALGFGVTGGG